MSVYIKFGIILFLLVISPISVTTSSRNETCTSPTGKDGTCVPLSQCQEIVDAISSDIPVRLDHVKQSYCGFDDETLVCCEQPSPVTPADLNLPFLKDDTICGLVKEKPRIWGGELADIGEFPWMVALEYKSHNKTYLLCGGSLISDEFVLTAAVCFITNSAELQVVRLGELDTTTDPDCKEFTANKYCAAPVKFVEIERKISHPLFNKPPGFNDIGIIQLKKKVRFTDFIRPICLPFLDISAPSVGEQMITAGWGYSELGNISTILRKVKVPIVSDDVCKVVYANVTQPIGRSQFCAGVSGKNKKGAWTGDVGAPLMRIYTDEENELLTWYQDGITSYSFRVRQHPISPAVYTKVTDYIKWIATIILKYRRGKVIGYA